MKGIKIFKVVFIKQVNHGDEKYSRGTTGNNIVLTLYGDYIHCGEH